MSGDKRSLLRQRLESGEIRLQPLSLPQRELWEASPVAVEDTANHICALIEVRGKVTLADGRAAVRRVVERQEVLRLSFLPGKEAPLQMIRRDGVVVFNHREVPPEQNTPEGIEEIARSIFHQPFDLLQGPLYRIEMLQQSEDQFVWVFAIHHAIADGWTLGVFVQELALAYVQQVKSLGESLPAVPLTSSTWAANDRAYWQPAEIESRASFWKTLLANPPRLWRDFEGPQTAAGPHRRVIKYFPPELATAARDCARKSGATLFSTLLTAFQVAMWRWKEVTDVLVGTPVANRTKQNVKETMGYFAGIVPLRGEVKPERTFSASLAATQTGTVECFGNAIPFVELARLVGDLASPGHNPIFEIRFALQNHPVPDANVPGLSAKLRMRSTGTARYHLACEITEEGDRLEVVWLSRPHIFPEAHIERLHTLFQNLLFSASRAPDTPIAELSFESR